MAPRRTAISTAQKAALRARRRQHPNASLKQLADWFQGEYGHRLSSSSISEILSARYSHLDGELTEQQANAKRLRPKRWPELESALNQYILAAEPQMVVTEDMIREKAQYYWNNIPAYRGKEMPVFSSNWISRLQQRKTIREQKQQKQQSEQQGNNDENYAAQILAVRETLSRFSPRDIFSCGEASLFWKQMPDRSFSARNLPGVRERPRISAVFCCNADGSQKLAPWFVGMAKQPRAFTAAGVRLENLGLCWCANGKGWVSPQIFEEWVRWFDASMHGRQVALLLDHYSVHQAAVQRITSSNFPLQNTTIIWLPRSSAGRTQPLDQGIISTWKTTWKHEWIRYIINEFDKGRDPLVTMNVLKAVRWAVGAWQRDITSDIIQLCFQKALSTERSHPSDAQPLIAEISQALFGLQLSARIKDPMDVASFVHPADEIVQDNLEELDDLILSQFRPEEEQDDDQVVDDLAHISHKEALDALEKLRLYEEQQVDGDAQLILELYRLESVIKRRTFAGLEQTDMRNYFSIMA
ncbi:hypothetical protein VTN49DRAFT_6917 [Thermomyces lanuginosus]|uniref:uncharacterized protein n=1 Tax=Thermomyces lanuginosus TaxID=5541 RepID=UPI0037440560